MKFLSLLVVLLVWCSGATAQWAVIDATAHAQRAANQTAQLAEMARQWQQLFDQYQRMGEQLDAVTKTRNLKALLGLQDIQTLIDPVAFARLQQLAPSGVSEITLMNNRNLHAQAIRSAQAIEDRKADIDRLLGAASSTTDAKAAADLTARATAQNAVLLNELLYQMELQKAAIAKNLIDEQRLRDERYAHIVAGRANPFKLKLP